jgi:RES domain-containing protein
LIVYTAEHPAVSLVETLVHLAGDPLDFPERYQLIEIAVPQELLDKAETLPFHPDIAVTQFTGNEWLESKRTALAVVPSIPSPKSKNYLFNPLHPEAAELKIAGCSWITYDKRIFKTVPDALKLPPQIERKER